MPELEPSRPWDPPKAAPRDLQKSIEMVINRKRNLGRTALIALGASLVGSFVNDANSTTTRICTGSAFDCLSYSSTPLGDLGSAMTWIGALVFIVAGFLWMRSRSELNELIRKQKSAKK